MDEFKITQDYVIYNVKKECIFPIKETEWNRLKSMIESIIPHKKIFQILSSILWGVFASSIFSLIGFQTAKDNLDKWVLPTTWAIFFVSLFLGICLLILDNQQKEIINNSAESVLSEMETIEKSLEIPNEQ
jgi:cbb3-type cytochrome oxidase subunit 3